MPDDLHGAHWELVSRSLSGGGASWPAAAAPDPGVLLRETRDAGVQPLLHWHLDRSGDLATWPPSIVEALFGARRAHAIVEELRRAELNRVAAALADRGVRFLVAKGAALAYTHYPEPSLRPRRDTDVVVRRTDAAAIRDAMAHLGYATPPQVSGDLILHQFHRSRVDRHGVQHAFDFHWKVSNVAVFADVLGFDELWRDSLDVPDFAGLRAPSAVHALLLACTHRVAHHNDRGDLVWVYDIGLLVRALGARLEAFADLAIERRMAAVCERGLRLAVRWFDAPVDEPVLARLQAAAARGHEPSARFLGGRLRELDLLVEDLAAVDGWSRLRLLWQHAFPAPSYVMNLYATSNRALLPVLYARRLLRGARGLLRRAG